LKRPFPHLPEALAGPGGIVPAIMPERLAMTSPFKPVDEIVGSGPYRFLPQEHITGARAAYERFPLYQPRAGGSVGFTSGPKIAHFDRVEWLTLDPFSAMAALHAGEIDWWELPPTDLVGNLPATAISPSFPIMRQQWAFCASTTCTRPSTMRRFGEHCSALSIRPRR